MLVDDSSHSDEEQEDEEYHNMGQEEVQWDHKSHTVAVLRI